jgi:AsmA protein
MRIPSKEELLQRARKLRMPRVQDLKRIPRKVQIAFASVALLLLIVASLPLFIDVNRFLPEIDAQLTAALGRPVTLGSISINLFEGGLVAKDLSIADDPAFSSQPFLQAKSLEITVNFLPLLLEKELSVSKFEVVKPSIQLIQNASGKWNFSTIGTSAATQPAPSQTTSAPAISVGHLEISDAEVTVQTQPSTAVHVYDKVNIEVKDFSSSSQFPFTFSAQLPAGGSMKLTGTGGPLDPVDNTLTPLTADLTVTKLNPVASGFLLASSGLDGVLDVTAHLASDGKTAQLDGNVTGNKMRFALKGAPMPSPVTVDFSTTYSLTSMQGQVTKGSIKAGAVSANVGGTYLLKPAGAEVHMDLSAPGMSVDALQTLMPAFGVVLPSGSGLKGGTLSASFKIDGPVDNLVIVGPVDLKDTELEGFSLMSKLESLPLLDKLKSGQQSSGTAIQSMHADIRMTQPQLETSNISAVVPSIGDATGSGVILPSGALDYKMHAKINDLSDLTTLMGAKNGIPLNIKGTSSDPSFSLDTSGMKPSLSSATGAAKNAGTKLKGLFKK